MTSVEYYPGYSQTQIKENLTVQTIASVTQANPCVVTTVNDHGYVAGMMVTFLITPQFGMVQLNRLNRQVLSVTSNTLTLDLNSTGFTAFAYPSPLPSAYTPPSVIPTSSGPYLPPIPLPYGNQDSFEGVIYNNGQPNNPINGGL
jgi:hypothetical protein